MRLVIQTNIPGRVGVWVMENTGQVKVNAIRRISHHGSERLLVLVHDLLRKLRIEPIRVSELIIVRGPGPFTAVRTGLVVANTLGWLWGIPVRGVVRDQFFHPSDLRKLVNDGHAQLRKLVRPWYGREPNISISKLINWA